MKNRINAFVDALSAVISPSLEATFDFLEYRIALADKRKRGIQTNASQSLAFSSNGSFGTAEEIHMTGFAN